MGHHASAGPTLAVIAREAGVSLSTASKVLNGREAVSPDTRRRVQDVLDRLGYVHKPRFDAGRPPAMVDIVVHRLNGAFSAAILEGVEEAAHQAGMEIIVSAALTRNRAGRPERGWLDKLATRGSAGVLFHLAELSPSQATWLTGHHIPYVMIDPAVEPPSGVPSVGAANQAGAVSATEHLLALGHRRIAVIGGSPRKLCSEARIAGYRSALAAAGQPVRPDYVRYGDFTPELAEQRMLELLDLPEPPTAVLACSDLMAIAACRAVAARGVLVPGDISVIGFDDRPEASWARPALTTVQQPLVEMATTALRMLVGPTVGESAGNDRVELPTRLVLRESTAPPAS